MEEISNKALQPEKPAKSDKHFYPDHGIVIEAESKEEADKILEEKLKKVIIKTK